MHRRRCLYFGKLIFLDNSTIYRPHLHALIWWGGGGGARGAHRVHHLRHGYALSLRRGWSEFQNLLGEILYCIFLIIVWHEMMNRDHKCFDHE